MDYRKYVIEHKVFHDSIEAYKFYNKLITHDFSTTVSVRVNAKDKSIDIIVRWKQFRDDI